MSERPHLERLLGAELDALERIVAHSAAGKHRGQSPAFLSADFHFAKADSHQVRAGTFLSNRDEGEGGTGELHILHAACRLLMVGASVRESDTIDRSEAGA